MRLAIEKNRDLFVRVVVNEFYNMETCKEWLIAIISTFVCTYLFTLFNEFLLKIVLLFRHNVFFLKPLVII